MKKIIKWLAIGVSALVVLFVGAIFLSSMMPSSYSKPSDGMVLNEGLGVLGGPNRMSISNSKGMDPDSSMVAQGEVEDFVDDMTLDDKPMGLIDKKIVKSGDLTLKVNNTENAIDKISQIARKNQGSVFSSNVSRAASGQIKRGFITAKVPMEKFEETFSELKEVASLVLNESISSQDVTEQYTDLQSRLKNKQAEETSLLKILERSGEIKDVLAVTKELSSVRGQIEVFQGRIRLMESQTDMSTISISMVEDANITAIDNWRPWQVLKSSVNGLLDSLQGFVNFIIKFIIQVIPILFLYGLIVWVFYKVGKKIFLWIKGRKRDGKGNDAGI